MADQFPLVINFQGDYGMKLLLVDPQTTINQVAQLAKDSLVGVVVKPLPEGTVLVVRRHGESAALDGSVKVADAGFVKMEALDIVHAV
jgi:toluene monooxygenase system protein B